MATRTEGSRATPGVPPHSVEAEQSVLGAAMLSGEAASIAVEKLRFEDFYRPAHQSIFEAVLALFDGDQAIDAITVSDWLRRNGALERVGGISALNDLMDSVPATSNIGYYVDIVDDTAARRRLLRAGSEVGALAMRSEEPIDEILNAAESEVFKVADRRVGEGLTRLGPMLQDTLEKIEEMGTRGGDITGVPTGFRDLDKKLAGLHPANLVVIAARPGMGKSSLAINIAQHVAEQGDPVALFTLEMSREEVVQRILSSMASVDSHRLRTGQLTPEMWQRVARESSRLYEMPFFVDDSADLTVTAIRAKCRRLKRKHKNIGLVVVDYMQLMQGPTRSENRQQEIAEISRSLKNLARELEVPVIAVSQLNRQLEQRENKRPRLGDLRESGAIEQDADVVLFIYRDEAYDTNNAETRGLAEVNIAKHRAGATGTMMMTFAAEFTRFRNFTREDPI